MVTKHGPQRDRRCASQAEVGPLLLLPAELQPL